MSDTKNLKESKKDHAHGHGHSGAATGGTDVNFRAIIKFGIWMSVAAIFIHGSMWVMFRYYLDSPEPPRPQPPSALATQNSRVPPKPQLQQDPVKDLKEYRSTEQKAINEGIVDQKTNIKSIPINEAMEIVLQKGLASRTLTEDPVVEEKSLRADSSSGRTTEKRVHW
jgi:hypothetical protein